MAEGRAFREERPVRAKVLGQEEVIGCLTEKVPHYHGALDLVDFAGRMFPMTRAGAPMQIL